MINGWDKKAGAATVLVMSIMLGGCQGYTNISSTKAAEFDQEFKRYSIINYAMPVISGEYVTAFQSGMLNRLSACGADAAFSKIVTRGNELTFDKAAAADTATNDTKIQMLNPDAVLVVREEMIQRRGLGAIVLARFFVELSDRATASAVWKASIELHPQTDSPTEMGAVLAKDLSTRMIKDGLLSGCQDKRA